jgi:hypothetical protein
MTETIELEQEIAEKLLSHVSEAYGEYSAVEKAANEKVTLADMRLREAVELAKTHGFTREELIERLEQDSDDSYIDESLFAEVFKRKR